jgi:hypothetical protein
MYRREREEAQMGKKYLAAGKSEAKLRLEDALRRHLMQAAKEKRVPLNAEMVARLQASVDHESPAVEKTPEPIAPALVDQSETIAKLQAENAQLRQLVASRRTPTARPGKLSTAKIAKLISDAKAGRLKKSGWFGDGNNLGLQIRNNGAAVSWIFRYDRSRFSIPGEKPFDEMPMGLGSYSVVDLGMARELADQYRRMLLEGKDPYVEREGAKRDDEIAQGVAKTVSEVFDEYFEAQVAHKSKTYQWQVKKWFRTFILPAVGDWPIHKVDQNTILNKCQLRDVWAGQRPTGWGLQNHLSRMFDLAIEAGYYTGKNPAAWKGLKHRLPNDRHRTKNIPGCPIPMPPGLWKSCGHMWTSAKGVSTAAHRCRWLWSLRS